MDKRQGDRQSDEMLSSWMGGEEEWMSDMMGWIDRFVP